MKRVQEFTIDGKTYNSLDEMPPEVRRKWDSLNNMFESLNSGAGLDDLEAMKPFRDEIKQTSVFTETTPLPRPSKLAIKGRRVMGLINMLFFISVLVAATFVFGIAIMKPSKDATVAAVASFSFIMLSLPILNMTAFIARLKRANPAIYQQATRGLGTVWLVGGIMNGFSAGLISDMHATIRGIATDQSGQFSPGLRFYARISRYINWLAVTWLVLLVSYSLIDMATHGKFFNNK